MFSATRVFKRAALPLGGLALFASAVIAGPANAQFQKDHRKNNDWSTTTAWTGAGGSVLWLVLGKNSGSSDPLQLADGGTKTLQSVSCTFILHGEVQPCNGVSP